MKSSGKPIFSTQKSLCLAQEAVYLVKARIFGAKRYILTQKPKVSAASYEEELPVMKSCGQL